MQEKLPFEQLDEILRYIKKLKQQNDVCTDAKLLEIPIINEIKSDLGPLLKKLEKDGDGYIYKYSIDIKSDKDKLYEANTIYSLTVEGDCFIQSGGYTQQQKDIKLKRFKDSVYINVVLIGSILAGFYALLQIIRFLYNLK
jgi:hypothetical protein